MSLLSIRNDGCQIAILFFLKIAELLLRLIHTSDTKNAEKIMSGCFLSVRKLPLADPGMMFPLNVSTGRKTRSIFHQGLKAHFHRL